MTMPCPDFTYADYVMSAQLIFCSRQGERVPHGIPALSFTSAQSTDPTASMRIIYQNSSVLSPPMPSVLVLDFKQSRHALLLVDLLMGWGLQPATSPSAPSLLVRKESSMDLFGGEEKFAANIKLQHFSHVRSSAGSEQTNILSWRDAKGCCEESKCLF